MTLKEQLEALPDPEAYGDAALVPAAVTVLSDEQLRLLDRLIGEEGIRRGFGDYWWE